MILIDVINEGWKVEIESVSKRMGDLNNRHWEDRVIWEATKDEYTLKSKWKGFVFAQNAIKDMCDKVNEL